MLSHSCDPVKTVCFHTDQKACADDISVQLGTVEFIFCAFGGELFIPLVNRDSTFHLNYSCKKVELRALNRYSSFPVFCKGKAVIMFIYFFK